MMVTELDTVKIFFSFFFFHEYLLIVNSVLFSYGT